MKKKGIKLIAGILSAAMLFILTGCSSKTSDAESAQNTPETYSYVMMNIPYSEFFAAEYEGGDQIDAVTSATKNKPGATGLTALSYHTEDLSQILGVSYPVAVPSSITLDASLQVADTDALYGAPDYSYVVLDEEPAFSKILSSDNGTYSFSASSGEQTAQEYTSVQLKTSSNWSEYEIDFDNSLSNLTVYAGILKTKEGNSYGMRVLENIWRGFEIGITTTSDFKDSHNSPLLTEPYADLPGQTINQIVYYTSDGIKTMDVDLYVPYKFSNTIEIADAALTDGKTTLTLTGYPDDYAKVYALSGVSSDIICDGENISWGNIFAGKYTLTVSDENGKYAPYSQSFIISTNKAAAAADNKNECLVAAKGVSEDQFNAYISNISSYTVGEKTVNASGHGAAALIKSDGTVDKTQSSVFSEVGKYEVIVHANGYPDITLNVNITEVAQSTTQNGGGAH